MVSRNSSRGAPRILIFFSRYQCQYAQAVSGLFHGAAEIPDFTSVFTDESQLKSFSRRPGHVGIVVERRPKTKKTGAIPTPAFSDHLVNIRS